jgi:hypothetical protein
MPREKKTLNKERAKYPIMCKNTHRRVEIKLINGRKKIKNFGYFLFKILGAFGDSKNPERFTTVDLLI